MATENDDQLVERLVPKVLSSIRAKAKAVESVPIKKDLAGITSLPAYDTTGGQYKNVLVPINALKEPAVEAGEAANAAAANADAAAAKANASADRVTEAILDLADEKLAVQKVVENETYRIANEEARQENEDARIAAETAREEAEAARAQAELDRVSAEESREAAEAVRQSNEQARIAEESDRYTAEQQRIDNENARQAAEAERVTADEQRKADYEALRADLVTNGMILLVSEKEYDEATDNGTIDDSKLYFAYED